MPLPFLPPRGQLHAQRDATVTDAAYNPAQQAVIAAPRPPAELAELPPGLARDLREELEDGSAPCGGAPHARAIPCGSASTR